jgi:hypothetical protein
MLYIFQTTDLIEMGFSLNKIRRKEAENIFPKYLTSIYVS